MIFVSTAWSQEEGAKDDDLLKNTRNDILVVAGATVAGGILGLSTLSFVDKPSKHLSNIWTGAAVGLIVGVVYVAYDSAQRGQESIEEEDEEEASLDFKTSERVAWHSENQNLSIPQVQFGTQIWQMNF